MMNKATQTSVQRSEESFEPSVHMPVHQLRGVSKLHLRAPLIPHKQNCRNLRPQQLLRPNSQIQKPMICLLRRAESVVFALGSGRIGPGQGLFGKDCRHFRCAELYRASNCGLASEKTARSTCLSVLLVLHELVNVAEIFDLTKKLP